MTPKPIVEPMWYVWDWRGFIQKHLWPITYHTRYNSFKIEKQNGDVKFRCKRLPQSLKYGPNGNYDQITLHLLTLSQSPAELSFSSNVFIWH